MESIFLNRLVFPAAEDPPIPHAVVEKQFLLSDGRVRLEASLDRAIYGHGDAITVRVHVTNNSGKSVKRIEVSRYYIIIIYRIAVLLCCRCWKEIILAIRY